jgi:aryl-alcohol dehydrogenase-like predicted oxidoreductase
VARAAWTLVHPAVQVAIVGSRSARHIEESIGALGLELTDDDLSEIDRILGTAPQVEWPTPEAMTEYLNLAA